MKFIDFFSGIGGFRLGMEMAGHECVGHCEIDKYADKSYRAMHQVKENEWYANDITRVEPGDLPTAECYCGGFPCQAFSIAGKRGGFDDTRGTLFFEVMRLARVRRPEYLFLENVKGLLSHDGGRTFGTIISALGELGYDAEWQVLNSKNFGVPQNRERVFIIGHLRGRSWRRVFPIGDDRKEADNQHLQINDSNNVPCKLHKISDDKKFASVLDATITDIGTNCASTVTARYYKGISGHHDNMVMVNQIGNLIDTDSFGGNPQTGRVYAADGLSPCLSTMQGGQREPKVLIVGNTNPSGNGMNGNVFDSEGLAPTLTTNKGEGNKVAIPVLTPDRKEKRQNGRRFKEDGEPMFTLTSQDRHGVMVKQATKQGFIEVEEGGVFDMSYPDSETRRGRVQEGGKVTPTVTANSQLGVVVGVIDDQGRLGKRCEPTKTVPTLRAQSHGNEPKVVGDYRIRKLTPKETFRLQGFPDECFERAKSVNSNSQLYKQAGNSVTVNVIYEIARRLE